MVSCSSAYKRLVRVAQNRRMVCFVAAGVKLGHHPIEESPAGVGAGLGVRKRIRGQSAHSALISTAGLSARAPAFVAS